MPNYPIHTIASAPENSKPGHQQVQQAFGVVPNIAAAVAPAIPQLGELLRYWRQERGKSHSLIFRWKRASRSAI